MFNCLSLERLTHGTRLTLKGYLGRPRGSQTRFPSWFPFRVIYCEDAQFAYADRRAAFELARGTFPVGTRMDAILKGGPAWQALIRESEAA